MSFPAKLRSLRKSRKIGIRELSKRLHYDRAYLSRIENGAVTPSDELIKAVAKFFKISVLELRLAAGKFPKDVLEILSKDPEKAVSVLRDTLGKNLVPITGLYCCGQEVEISNDAMNQHYAITFQATCTRCNTSFDVAVKSRPGHDGWWMFRAVTLGRFEHAVKEQVL